MTVTLRDEVREQPAVLARLLQARAGDAEEIAGWIRARAVTHVVMAGRGTSMHAGYYAKYAWGVHNGLDVSLAAPSLFTKYRRPPRLDGALVVGISQSGQSPDVVAVLAHARGHGRPTLAITNDPSSPLAVSADRVFDIGAAPEHMVAATKSYTAQLAALAMLSVALAANEERRRQLRALPALVDKALALEDATGAASVQYRGMQRCAVVGRGYDYATTHEAALKLKELTYVVAERYSAADFRHGPIAMVARGFPVLALAARGAVSPDVVELLRSLRDDCGANLLVVSNEPEALALARAALPLPDDLPEWLSPIVSIVPCQLFAYHLARAKGIDPAAPRGLRKVTRTQ